ncbi:MAG: flippase [Alphaproteobacteria bacterium]
MSTSRVLRNASMLGVAQAVSMAAGFVSTAWLARMLGPESYGILGFGTAFVSYFALAVVFGTDLYGTREIASAPEKTRTVLSRILGARLILLVLVGAIYIAVISVIDRPRDVIVVMFIQILGLLSAAVTVDFLFQGVQRMGPIAVRQGAAALAAMIAVLFLIRGPEDVFAAAAIPFSAMLISALLLGIFAHRRITRIGFSFETAGLRDVLAGSAPILLAGLMSLVFLNVDVVMLGFLRSAEEVGIYAGMGRLFVLSMVAGHIVSAAFAPALAAAASDADDRRATYYRHIRIVMFLGVPVCAAIIAFPEWTVQVIFGEEFLAGTPILSLLALAAVIAYACMAPLTALVSWRDQTAQMFILSIVAAANVVLNFWLILAHGGIGAAVATLAAQALMFALLIYRVRSKFGVFGFAAAGGMIVCGIIAFALARLAAEFLVPRDSVFSTWVAPLLLVIAASGLYIALTCAVGIIRRADLTAVLYIARTREAEKSEPDT